MNTFTAFTPSHWTAMFVMLLAGYLIIQKGMRLSSPEERTKFGFFIALIPILFFVFRDAYVAYLGIYDYKKDLPLHLCRMSALLLPIMHWTKNRFIFGLLYFWTLVGAGNAVITPDLVIDFPSFEYFVYFIGHCFLIIGTLYAVFVYKMIPGKRDFRNAIIGTNGYVILSMGFNYLLGANYFYTLGKPEVPTLLDFLGPWPIYLVTGQLLMFMLFVVVMMPFHIKLKAVRIKRDNR